MDTKTEAVMLTTFDNPYSPFKNFEQWLQFDNEHDYGTCEFLAHFVFTSDSLSESENNEEMERAIDWIVKNDPRQIYRKVHENDYKSQEISEDDQ